MKILRLTSGILTLCLILVGFSSNVSAQTRPVTQLPELTGEHWSKASDDEKKAYLFGFGTMLSAEHHVQGDKLPTGFKSLTPTFYKGFSGMTFTDLQNAIEAYYKQNPNQLKRPIIEVMWFEIAVPNAQKK